MNPIHTQLNSKKFKVLLPILILVVGVAVFTVLMASRKEPEIPKPREKVWQVSVLNAQPHTISPHLTLYGETETPELLNAASPGEGLVAEVLVRKGDLVEPDQLMIALDTRDFELDIEQMQADVQDLEAQLVELDLRHANNQQALKKELELVELAKAEVARETRLRKQNLSAESALDIARNALGKQELSVITRRLEIARYQASRRQLEARLIRNQAKLAEARLTLERSRVSSPFAGVIADVPVSVGDRVRLAETLVSLYPNDGVELRARIPTRYQAEIQRALSRDIKLTAGSSFVGHEIRLELDRLGGEADASGIDAYFRVTEGIEWLRLGNLLKINLTRPPMDNLVPIPFQAIYGNERIYLLVDERMSGVDVEVIGQYMPEQGERMLLIRDERIKPGDQIVQTHLPNATSGLKVKVVPQ